MIPKVKRIEDIEAAAETSGKQEKEAKKEEETMNLNQNMTNLQKEEEDDVGLEEERGPGFPLIYVPRPEDVFGERDRVPPTLIYVQTPPPAAAPTPFRRNPNKNKNKNKNENKPIDFELLKKLQQSPFRRFRKVKKVRFGGRK